MHHRPQPEKIELTSDEFKKIESVFIALLAERNNLTRNEIQAHMYTLNLPHNKKNKANSTHRN